MYEVLFLMGKGVFIVVDKTKKVLEKQNKTKNQWHGRHFKDRNTNKQEKIKKG